MTVNRESIARVYSRARRRLLGPDHCRLCGARLPPDTLLCHHCMEAFEVPARPLCRCGLTAALPPETLDRPELCGRCLKRPPPFDGVWPALVYASPLDRLIADYKHRGQLARERLLLRLWRARLCQAPPPGPDALVPLPCHWRRQWRRGFSQPDRMAAELARTLDRPLLRALERRRATPAQQGLSRAARERNLDRAFQVVQPVKGLHLALIDDVMTTGSSARLASRVLRDAGAARIDVWVLARTPPSAAP